MRSTIIVAAALVALTGGWAPARAQLGCGDTVGPGEKATLTADVGPCTSATDPAVRVTGPATLDLAGFRVLCDPNDPPTGIILDGRGAKVMRGSTHDCVSGLDLDGEGKHKVEDFVVMNSSADGVPIGGEKSKLRRVAAIGSGDDGFDVEGDGNKIEDAEAVGNGTGFEVEGDGNKLSRIVASSSDGDGMVLGGDGNRIKDCRITVNDQQDGIDVDGDDNKISKCLVTGSGANNGGIDVDGDGNKITANLVVANDEGITLSPGTVDNVVKKNVALGNATIDLKDGNAGCGANSWKKNKFGTSEADGVADPACIE